MGRHKRKRCTESGTSLRNPIQYLHHKTILNGQSVIRMKLSYLTQPISDQERSERLFSGELLIYRQIPAMLELIEQADIQLKEALDGLEPDTAQYHFDRDEFLNRTGQAQTAFRKDAGMRTLFFEVLKQCGVNIDATYYDHFPMRIVPFANSHDGAHRAAIGHHRDSWGSNIHCQQNWWAPLYTLEAQRSITFYPDYWHQPLTNNTEQWRFSDYLASRQQGAPERAVDYPSAPGPTEAVDEGGARQIMLNPGDVLNFASAHLHASAINTTTRTRFSVEMRTICEDDLEAGRYAPNVDNEGVPPMYSWFKSISGLKPLEVAEPREPNCQLAVS